MPKSGLKYCYPIHPDEWDQSGNDPIAIIDRFFSFHSLKHYRSYITSMLKAAYSEGYWKKSYPGSLLNFQNKMEELMITAHSLNRQKQGVHRNAWKTSVILTNFTFTDETIPLSAMEWMEKVPCGIAFQEVFPKRSL